MSHFPLPSHTSRATSLRAQNSRRHTLRSRIFVILLISMLALPSVVPPVKTYAAPASARRRPKRLPSPFVPEQYRVFRPLCRWQRAFAMYRVGVAKDLVSERDFFEGNPKLLSSPLYSVRENEKGRVEGQYFRAGVEALKAACGEAANKTHN